MKKKVLLDYKEPEKEKVKINNDLFKQKEQIITVNTTSKEEKIIKKKSEKFFVGLFITNFGETSIGSASINFLISGICLS